MRPPVVFCAIAFGLGCDASAAELGLASFYGAGYGAGGLTAAHRSLPMGSQVRILNLDNGRSVVVRIVDRGPFIRGRVIDVSPAVAVTLGFREAGLARVKVDPISLKPGRQPSSAPSGTWAYAVCRSGADRLERLDEATAPPRNALGCENLRLRLFRLAESTDDLSPVIARTRLYPIGLEAAATIPVSALAELEAAASIPVTALAEGPARQASPPRPARGCGAAEACGKGEQAPAANPALSLFTRLRHIFD